MEHRYTIIRVSYCKVTNHIVSSLYGSYISFFDAFSDLTPIYHDLVRDLCKDILSCNIDSHTGTFTIETKFSIHQFDIK